MLHGDYLVELNIKSLEIWKEVVLGKGTGHAMMETQANMFASFLLMPRDRLAREFEKGVRAVPITIRYQKETPENSQQIHLEARRLYEKAERMKIKDLKKAFDLMCRNIWGWWD